jgi:hypothetical protein
MAEAGFGSAFEPYGGEYEEPAFFKDAEGVVHLKGLLRTKVNASGVTVSTLPNGYRPAATDVFAVVAGSSTADVVARVHVSNDGLVRLVTPIAANNFVSLSGITFRAV